MKKKIRKLTEEDEKSWSEFTKNIEKHKQISQVFLLEKCKSNAVSLKPKKETTNKATSVQSRAPNKNDILSINAIDKKLSSKLKKGQAEPEKKLDLHGLSFNKARNAVRTFVLSAYSSHIRLVLIVTGKGQKRDKRKFFSDESDIGILRKSLPTWLQSTELEPLILSITSAHISHGGSGAYYVYLRKNKNL
tara:strand:+ start:493 stop:1065 length:573 start_codon:yes stop_codon:yes gene_type:complete